MSLSSTVSQYPGNGQTGVVVHDALGNASQERERRDVSVAERLGGLGRVCPGEHGITVRKVEDEEVDLTLHSSYYRPRLPEVALGVSGRMHERHEHLTCPQAALSDVVLDDRVPAVEAVLVSQAIVYALGGVPLLPGKAESLPVRDTGSSSSMRSMTPVYGPILGLLGGLRLRYPGGTEYASILRTVSLCYISLRRIFPRLGYRDLFHILQDTSIGHVA